jgi:hypothetical protein
MFDGNVFVKIEEAGESAGSKTIVPPAIQKLPVFFMDAAISFNSLPEHIANKFEFIMYKLGFNKCELSHLCIHCGSLII